MGILLREILGDVFYENRERNSMGNHFREL